MHLMGHVPCSLLVKQLWVVLHAMQVAIHVLLRDELSDWGEIGMHGMLLLYCDHLIIFGKTINTWRYELICYCLEEIPNHNGEFGHEWICDSYHYINDAAFMVPDMFDEIYILLRLVAGTFLPLLDICLVMAENFVDDPFGLHWMKNPWGVIGVNNDSSDSDWD